MGASAPPHRRRRETSAAAGGHRARQLWSGGGGCSHHGAGHMTIQLVPCFTSTSARANGEQLSAKTPCPAEHASFLPVLTGGVRGRCVKERSYWQPFTLRNAQQLDCVTLICGLPPSNAFQMVDRKKRQSYANHGLLAYEVVVGHS